MSVSFNSILCDEKTFSSFIPTGRFKEGTALTPDPSLHWLALAGVEFAAKVLRRCIQEPVGVHQAQIPHVAAGRVQQLVEDHVRRLGLEQDGGWVDSHGLTGVQSQVAAVGLQLGGVDEHPVGKAAA